MVLLVVAVLVAGCDAFSSSQPTTLPPPTDANPSTPKASGGTATLPVPLGACQSRLWGKITNATTGQSPANIAVEADSGNNNFKTVTDANGLYGFAGLCAAEYSLTLTPPGGKPILNPNKVALDGKQATKVDLSYK